MKLLIIEDEPALQEEMKNFLEKENYICETAANFNDADEKISVYHYDVALIDITLPGGNGLQLIENLKKQNNDTGIIIISARNSLDDKLTGLDLGADDYITKPFHLSELNARVKAVLRRRKFDGAKNIIFNEIELLPDEGTVKINRKNLVLTKKNLNCCCFSFRIKTGYLPVNPLPNIFGATISIWLIISILFTHTLTTCAKKL